MNDRAPALDDATLKFGLLMESAQAHQKLAETHLEKLRTHTQDLDGVVREEIRRTLIEELQELTAEAKRAVQALHGMKRAANMRGLLWGVVMAAVCTLIPSAIAHWALPSPGEIAALRVERDRLARDIAGLEQQGGRVDWRHSGNTARLCVRVDRAAPAYGEKADYYIVQGY
jgi:hypothetical protein